MSRDALKKVFAFSTEEKKYLIESILADESAATGQKIYSLMEGHFESDMLPQNPTARNLVTNNLYCEEGSTKRLVNTMFSENAAGSNWRSVESNFKEVVEFSQQQQTIAGARIRNKDELPYFIKQMESIVTLISDLASATIDEQKRFADIDNAAWAADLISELKSGYTTQYISHYYQIILAFWKDICDWTITYRALSALVAIGADWPNSAESRIEILNIVKKISKDWGDGTSSPVENIPVVNPKRLLFDIDFEFKDSGKSIAVFANDVNIGNLTSLPQNILSWTADKQFRIIRHAVNDENILVQILNVIKKYAAEAGYNKLVIDNYASGVRSIFPDHVWIWQGFHQEDHPALLYLDL